MKTEKTIQERLSQIPDSHKVKNDVKSREKEQNHNQKKKCERIAINNANVDDSKNAQKGIDNILVVKIK
jgi:hypothetical protein